MGEAEGNLSFCVSRVVKITQLYEECESIVMNSISVAIKGKGLFNFLRRTVTIAKRYGGNAELMDCALAQFVSVLHHFGCSATFPITSVALARNPKVITKYQEQGIEFAIHGYRHLDHSQLPLSEQAAELTLAKQVFAKAGIQPRGFRGPYLRWNSDTLAVLQQQGLSYDASPGLAWDVLDGNQSAGYRQALNFYRALSANDYPSLPSLRGNLVSIPYSLPDDEALVERLTLRTSPQMSALWLAILQRTYELGELFVIGLHPERFPLCRAPLEAVLEETRRLMPAVWIARLDEIDAWWRTRITTLVSATDTSDGKLHMSVSGPSGVTVLIRHAEVDAYTRPWADAYHLLESRAFTVSARTKPLVGLSPTSSPRLADFLRQQGYIVEIGTDRQLYSYYFDEAQFTPEQERSILSQIEGAPLPLVRLGRWPNGARSAVAITGDIDALTLWDYGLRFLGR
jgi:peptidoglycan/xylan/chitin deacetylase (PgdA/CDA1 family)